MRTTKETNKQALDGNIKLVEIDRQNPQDVRFVENAILKYYPNSPFPPKAHDIKTGGPIYFKAYLDQTIIGMSGLSPKSPYLAETVKTIVFEEFRGKKLGQALSWAIEFECVRRGYTKIMTGVYTFNHAMLSIKMKQGYTIEGHHQNHEKPGLHEYTLGKFFPENVKP